ncbi:MAG TPA: DNA-3-methyladenine glycosylase I [Candidatus Nanoarchaeia archaeon]|nr:DNA-3-methyladenine glycosylase I [Candidatus Nanoarchaeia archaeon]
MPETWQPPDWWCTKGKRPANDNAYFENMCRIIFQAGLNWSVIDKKWPTTRKAFANFSVEQVALFKPADEMRLMKDEGIVRNLGKIEAIIENAKKFQEICKQFGSFTKYLDSLDKSNNYASVVKELSSKFKWLGPYSASMFLYTVGENIKHEGWM